MKLNFKPIFLFAYLIIVVPVFSFANDFESRIAALESKVQVLEEAMSKKLSQCELVFRPHTIRLNRCDRGTFPRSVTITHTNAVQLECGYYQLQCDVQ